MREILFRGKRADNGEWVEGHYFSCWDKNYICWGTINENIKNIEVIPETVGQFTGKFDKNGKKIFEGDIVELLGFGLGEIKWFNDDAMLIIEGKEFQHVLGVFHNREMEVVGNFLERTRAGESVDIRVLELTVRAENVLRRAYINTINELIEYTKEDYYKLRELPNMGKKTSEEIVYKLIKYLGRRENERQKNDK